MFKTGLVNGLIKTFSLGAGGEGLGGFWGGGTISTFELTISKEGVACLLLRIPKTSSKTRLSYGDVLEGVLEDVLEGVLEFVLKGVLGGGVTILEGDDLGMLKELIDAFDSLPLLLLLLLPLPLPFSFFVFFIDNFNTFEISFIHLLDLFVTLIATILQC